MKNAKTATHPIVTAVIVGYRSVDLLPTVLGSLQDAMNLGILRCIVVDNNSNDGSAKLIKNDFPDVDLVVCETNVGFGRGCNIGIQLAQTKHILLINPDAILPLDALQILIKFMETHPEAGIVGPSIKESDGTFNPIGDLPTSRTFLGDHSRLFRRQETKTPVRPGDEPRQGEWICGAVMLLRARMLDEVGNFDPRFFLYFEETDLCRRVIDSGWQIWAVGESISFHIMAASSSTSSVEKYHGCIASHYFQSRYYYLKKHLGAPKAALIESLDILLASVSLAWHTFRGKGGMLQRCRLKSPKFEEPPILASDAREIEPRLLVTQTSRRKRVEPGMRNANENSGLGAQRDGWKRRRLLQMQKGLGLSRVAKAFRSLRSPHGAIILMYHSVVTDETSAWIDPRNSIPLPAFRRQMDLLAESQSVISMTQLVDSISSGESPPPGSIVITFDDGYLDNFQLAAPILNEFHLPAIIYLATSYVDESRPQWIDHLYSSFTRRQRHSLRIEGQEQRVFILTKEIDRTLAYQECSRLLLGMTKSDRNHLLNSLDRQLLPNDAPPRLTMNWEETRQLRLKFPNIEIGAHTRDHLDLTNHQRLAQQQMKSASQDIRRELGLVPSHFSFPYCRSHPHLRELAREVGFESAVASTEARLCTKTSDLFNLPRIEAPRSMALFRYYTSGAHPTLSKMLFGRA